MYHEVTVEMVQRRRRRWLVFALCVALVAGILLGWFIGTQDSLKEQGAASMRQAIMSSALQCCAIEGSYPQTLQHLEDNYGLTINHNDYVVTYEAFASNVAPSVVVVPK